jgi:maltose alpha-D-glucosyltransferase/alpha-amylase
LSLGLVYRLPFLPLGDAASSIPWDAEIEWPGPELAKSRLVVGRRAIIKLYRRVIEGIHPEPEMTRVLTERGFAGIPRLIGEVVRRSASGESSVLGVVETFVTHQGNGERWTHEQLARIIDERAVAPREVAADVFDSYWIFVQALGRRVGEMHAVLAEPSWNPAFAPEIVDVGGVDAAWIDARDHLKGALKSLLRTEDKDRRRLVAQLAARHDEILKRLARYLGRGLGSLRTRIHGDLHLGHVLVCGGDVAIVNFEGEPARPPEERRAKRSPMRDVASLVDSFDTVADIIERDRKFAAGAPGQARASELLNEFRRLAERKFLDAYGEGRGRQLDNGERQIIEAFTIEKAAREIVLETGKRPDWVDIRVRGLARRLQRAPEFDR